MNGDNNTNQTGTNQSVPNSINPTNNILNTQSVPQTAPINNTVPANQPIQEQVNTPVNNTVSNTQTIPQTPPVVNSSNNNNNDDSVEYEYVVQKKSHKSVLFILLLLLIIAGMGYYIYTDYQKDEKNKCSPLVTETNKRNDLKLNSTIVQDLYQKVRTDIKEDIADSDLDDKMKLYLAYRQIPSYEKYESNCNLFNSGSMQYITCDSSAGFIPMAFKETVLQREVKKLFGEEVTIANNNIQLGSSCIGGYQYISERGEYVEGQCNNTTNTIYQVEKKLISAYAYNDTIVLKEKVRYYGSDNVDVERLKNGIYVYTFKLEKFE